MGAVAMIARALPLLGVSLVAGLVLLLPAAPVLAEDVDVENAMAIARKGSCLRCHAVDKRKKAPSYQEIGKKFSAKPNGEALLTQHVTGKNMVKVENKDEDHDPIPAKDDKEVKNFVRWVMTR
jgi:cytochrome c